MSKRKKIIIGVAVALAAAICVGVALYGSRLKAAVSVAQSAAMDADTVEAKNTENAQIAEEMQEQYQIPDITLTPEMQAAIADGSMTLEEAAAQLLAGDTGKTDALAAEDVTPEPSAAEEPVKEETPVTPVPVKEESPPAPEPVKEETPPAPEPVREETPPAQEPVKEETPPAQEPVREETPAPEPVKEETPPVAEEPVQQKTPPVQEPAQPTAEEQAQAEREARIQNLFAQLYVLRDSFIARLENVVTECQDEFLALEPEKQTNTAKIRIVYAHMDDVETMEAECDAQVEQITAQLAELDPELSEKAAQYYRNEKELKKAELVARYTGRAVQ